MITPAQMEYLKECTKTMGDSILAAITERPSHTYEDVALMSYIYHANLTVTLRNTRATREQIADMIAISAEVGEFACAEVEREMSAVGILREVDA